MTREISTHLGRTPVPHNSLETLFDAGSGAELAQMLSARRGGGGVENKGQYIAVGATHPFAAQEVCRGRDGIEESL